MLVTCAGEDAIGPCSTMIRLREGQPVGFCSVHKARRVPRLGRRLRLQALIPADLYDWLHEEARRSNQSVNQLTAQLLEGARAIRNYTTKAALPREKEIDLDRLG